MSSLRVRPKSPLPSKKQLNRNLNTKIKNYEKWIKKSTDEEEIKKLQRKINEIRITVNNNEQFLAEAALAAAEEMKTEISAQKLKNTKQKK